MTLSKPLGFSELMFEVRLNPGVVDRNLKALLEHSLVERKENKYFLTEKGKKVVLLLKKFSEILSS
jgi:DNA-binding HxlR family transcriptional regulator